MVLMYSSVKKPRITDLSVIQYHSNGYYKLFTLHAQRELENRKRKGHRTESNEAESLVLVEQDRRSKQQKSNDHRSNDASYAETKLLEKTVNFIDYVKLKEQNYFCVQQNLIWIQFLQKNQSLINLMVYLQLTL